MRILIDLKGIEFVVMRVCEWVGSIEYENINSKFDPMMDLL